MFLNLVYLLLNEICFFTETRTRRITKRMEKLLFDLHKEEEYGTKIQIAAALIRALPKLDEVETKSEDLFNLESKVHKVIFRRCHVRAIA